MPSDKNKTQFTFWDREKFIKNMKQQYTKANDIPNKPLCHPMTSQKSTQGGRVGGKKNETVHNL